MRLMTEYPIRPGRDMPGLIVLHKNKIMLDLREYIAYNQRI